MTPEKIICSKCGEEYKIDPNRPPVAGMRINCANCNEKIHLDNREQSSGVQEMEDHSSLIFRPNDHKTQKNGDDGATNEELPELPELPGINGTVELAGNEKKKVEPAPKRVWIETPPEVAPAPPEKIPDPPERKTGPINRGSREIELTIVTEKKSMMPAVIVVLVLLVLGAIVPKVLGKEWFGLGYFFDYENSTGVNSSEPVKIESVPAVRAPNEKADNESVETLTKCRQLISSGKQDEAIKLLTQVSRSESHSAEANYLLGRAYSRAGNLELALEAYRRSVADDGKNAQSRFMLGQALIRAVLLKEAIIQLKQAAVLEPKWAKIRYHLGRAYYDNWDWELAMDAFKEAYRLDPARFRAPYMIGRCLMHTKNYEEAIPQFREALRIKPDYKKAQYMLARAYQEQGKPGDAFGYFKALSINGYKNPMLYYHLGFLYKEKGDTGNAVKNFNRYLELNPEGDFAKDLREEIDDLEHRVPANYKS